MTLSTAPPPSPFPAGETIWADDRSGGNHLANVDLGTAQRASGTQSHVDPRRMGHYHGFNNAWSQNFYVEASDAHHLR
jgi:hypothetical protein